MRLALGLIALAGFGCGDNLPTPPKAAQELESPKSKTELYASRVVWPIDIELSAESELALRERPREYVIGNVTIGETRIENVGVRLKGQFSFQNLGGKSSFKFKFNEYESGQRFVGLKKLTLNNMRQDRSQVHEWLSYRVFRELGLPAPRSGFAKVSVNGTSYGLYTNVETPDREFLAENFDDPTGNLYEAPWTADLDAENVFKFEQDEGADTTRSDLEQIVEQLAVNDDRAFFGADAAIDTDRFLLFMTAEAIVGHWDGYWKSNNYFLYHELTTGKWTWLPWGLDQSWDRDLDPFSSSGLVARKCLASVSCSRAYSAVALEALARIDWMTLEEELDSVTKLVTDYIESDPRSPHPAEKASRFQQITRNHLVTTSQRLWPRFDCFDDDDQAPVDRDGDSFEGCRVDCDDSNDLVYPGAEEICDGLDNDCDGRVDELVCPCQNRIVESRKFLFCESRVSWTLARALCLEHGGTLAVVENADRSALLFEKAEILDPNTSWFIGANDRLDEGAWLDADNESIALPLFSPGEPDDFGGQDCAVLASYGGGAWADDHCAAFRPFICEVPE